MAQGMKLYCLEEGPAALARIRAKILGTAAVTATVSTTWAMAAERNVMRTAPALTANAAVAVTAFAVCQEGVRALRQGEHDAWNSFIAGGLTGAALTRVAHGRGFHVLGAVMWAPLAGGLHWLNSTMQPSRVIKAWLAREGLLDLPEHERQQLQQQEQEQQHTAQLQQAADLQAAADALQEQQRKRYEDMTWREKARAVDAIKQREIEQLHEWMRQQDALAAAGGVARDAPASTARWRWFRQDA